MCHFRILFVVQILMIVVERSQIVFLVWLGAQEDLRKINWEPTFPRAAVFGGRSVFVLETGECIGWIHWGWSAFVWVDLLAATLLWFGSDFGCDLVEDLGFPCEVTGVQLLCLGLGPSQRAPDFSGVDFPKNCFCYYPCFKIQLR